MTTLETIKARCEEVGDCWEWKGCYTSKRHPTMRYEGKTWLIRRLILALAGSALSENERATTQCNNDKCVKPGHIVVRTHKQIMERQGAIGKLSDHARVAKIAATKRAKYAKLTMADARAIRASRLTHEKAAMQYGIHPSKVASIRQHRSWRELHGNPFAGLGARS